MDQSAGKTTLLECCFYQVSHSFMVSKQHKWGHLHWQIWLPLPILFFYNLMWKKIQGFLVKKPQFLIYITPNLSSGTYPAPPHSAHWGFLFTCGLTTWNFLLWKKRCWNSHPLLSEQIFLWNFIINQQLCEEIKEINEHFCVKPITVTQRWIVG